MNELTSKFQIAQKIQHRRLTTGGNMAVLKFESSLTFEKTRASTATRVIFNNNYLFLKIYS